MKAKQTRKTGVKTNQISVPVTLDKHDGLKEVTEVTQRGIFFSKFSQMPIFLCFLDAMIPWNYDHKALHLRIIS